MKTFSEMRKKERESEALKIIVIMLLFTIGIIFIRIKWDLESERDYYRSNFYKCVGTISNPTN